MNNSPLPVVFIVLTFFITIMTTIKSRLDARHYAVEKAVELMGAGSPSKDVIAKAKEIEAYIVGEADLPEVVNDAETFGNMLASVIPAYHDIVGK